MRQPLPWTIHEHKGDYQVLASDGTKVMADDSGADTPYLDDVRAIVDLSDVTIVCPQQMERQDRGGTWYTHDYSLKKGKRTIIVWPDGNVTEATS